MKRPFIAGVMGLAIAGCAHSRSELAKGPEGTNPVGPVGLTPAPSLRDTINRGVGDPALAQSALGDPYDSRWAGVAPSPDAIRSGATGTPSPAQSGSQSPTQSARSPQLAVTDSPPTEP